MLILLMLSFFLLLCLILVVILLLRAYVKSQSQTVPVILSLLRDERRENQSLRNQLRSPDVNTLMGMQQATMEDRSQETVVLDDDLPFDDTSEGYTLGALSDDFEAQGWSPPIVRKDEDGTYVAHEAG
jgi:hypothetical protein